MPILQEAFTNRLECRLYAVEKRAGNRLSMLILEQDGMTDFHTKIHTNLHIIYIGDSVANQFGVSLGDAVDATHAEVIRYSENLMKIAHVVKGIGGGLVATLRVTGWFVKNTQNDRRHLCPNGGGGWLQSDVTELRRFVNQWRVFQTLKGAMEVVTDVSEMAYPCGNNITTDDGLYFVNNSNDDGSSLVTTHQSTTNQQFEKEVKSGIQNATCSCVEKNYDVAVHQLAAGWIKLFKPPSSPLDQSITHGSIDDTVQFTFKSFGVNTIILQTIPINNNIMNAEELVKTNQQIWNYVRTFRQQEFSSWMESKVNATSDADVPPMRKILVMELGAFSISLNLHAAIHIGAVNEYDGLASAAADLLNIHTISPFKFNYGDSNFVNSTMVVFEKLIAQKLCKKRANDQHNYILSNVCMNMLNETQRNHTPFCENQNMFSEDGMHWCTDVIGPRLNAVVACLTKCSLMYNYDENGENGNLVDCERKCNEKFMTLTAIEWEDDSSMSIQF